MITVKIISIFSVLVCIFNQNVKGLSFPGPRVYVVTPSPRPFQVNQDNSVPFYYHSWMRRMDSEQNNTTPTTTPTTKTPDLIFAEFESDGGTKKSIRKLLEKERIAPKTTSTTLQPIYIPDEDTNKVTRIVNYGLPVSNMEEESPVSEPENDNANYFPKNSRQNYDNSRPLYMPTTSKPMTTPTTTPSPVNVENIWHIIDSEKFNQQSGNWDEVPVDSSQGDNVKDTASNNNESISGHDEETNTHGHDEAKLDENFALPGFGTNSGSGAENESRAIRTEPNIRFPYVNLKPFQMKNLKKPLIDALTNSKKGNNLYTNLDNFYDLKNPVRGEALDVGSNSMGQPLDGREQVDRYNPAQPYLPQSYGKGSKQDNSAYSPPKATANLVPPPPPPPSKGNDFPAPMSYESFPPYPPAGSDFGGPLLSAPKPAPVPAPAPASPPMPSPSFDLPQPDDDQGIDSYSPPSSDDGPPMDLGYRYKAPSPPQFLPTIAPVNKPFKGYSYDKPSMTSNNVPMSMPDMSDFQGYQYNKPSLGPQVPDPPTYDSPPSYGPSDSGPTYGHADSPPDHHDSDYPELIFNKHHGHTGGDHGDGAKGSDVGMMSPPDMKPDTYGAPPDDHQFPSDFSTDFKFHHDFDDHDHHYHHHEPPTSTTEMPRVNRFSYYYLGKKLYYLPLYFSVYFIVYVGALIIKAVLRHKIVYPNSWRPNTTTASFFSKRSVDEFLSNENLHEMTGRVTHALATAAKKYMSSKKKLE